ncbi:MAG: glycoside hydrolase family 19 protein [Candidatus Competibacter sp.]|nr:glycoside hydrolase family 19 protein [Candidatus Competibacter sp.]MDS4059291.1 glycoside hydrolase family 19 protein [Candidatus Contendobacter sp.]HRD49786.1 glycoside hydrolase family 19 protein [Candidatus Contendobacter sp.]
MTESLRLTANHLRDLVPALCAASAETHAAALNPALAEFDIATPRRIAACLAQFAHETGGFRTLREFGNDAYFARYDGRKALGNRQPGDGLRFKGRGYIQITGRANYAAAADALGLPLLDQPDLAEAPRTAARISCWWWCSRGLNALADDLQFNRITKKINGGLNGIDQRRSYWERAKHIWKEETP